MHDKENDPNSGALSVSSQSESIDDSAKLSSDSSAWINTQGKQLDNTIRENSASDHV